MPLPRFVSLKSDRINVRAGPGQDHKISWIFAKAGLPVEIVAEYENWRRIRDSEGAEGWVFHSLLSGRRTALVAPWSEKKTVNLMQDRDDGAVAARVEPGVLVNLEACDGEWCRIAVKDVTGWLPQDMLWGVYPKEAVE
jgi:SH3-like domain-containing protein